MKPEELVILAGVLAETIVPRYTNKPGSRKPVETPAERKARKQARKSRKINRRRK